MPEQDKAKVRQVLDPFGSASGGEIAGRGEQRTVDVGEAAHDQV